MRVAGWQEIVREPFRAMKVNTKCVCSLSRHRVRMAPRASPCAGATNPEIGCFQALLASVKVPFTRNRIPPPSCTALCAYSRIPNASDVILQVDLLRSEEHSENHFRGPNGREPGSSELGPGARRSVWRMLSEGPEQVTAALPAPSRRVGFAVRHASGLR